MPLFHALHIWGFTGFIFPDVNFKLQSALGLIISILKVLTMVSSDLKKQKQKQEPMLAYLIEIHHDNSTVPEVSPPPSCIWSHNLLKRMIQVSI